MVQFFFFFSIFDFPIFKSTISTAKKEYNTKSAKKNNEYNTKSSIT